MMRMQGFLVCILSVVALGAQAQNKQWLTHLIAEQEGKVTNTPAVQPNRKERHFFTTHGLILFYGSQCPHCKALAPVLKKWITLHDAKLLPLAFDNQPLPEFPHFLPATSEWVNAAFQGNAINYPAIFVVNTKTKALYPVGFGSMTEAELNTRMDRLLPKINDYEQKGRA
jgi:type-F conjugative transfer system pilin assembly thiol-disulfide isomerase TrbB